MIRALAILLALSAPAAAQTRGPDALTGREALLGWEAVGRVDIGGEGFCTGALIAPDLVLTAAHCLFRPDGTPVDAATITFRAGYVDGTEIAGSRVARAVPHPGYRTEGVERLEQLRFDVALLQLISAIPAATAAPFAVADPGVGADVSVVSYARGREEAPSWQRKCALKGRYAGVMAFDCDVTFGASGAPVFDLGAGGRARIVAIVSAGVTEGRERLAFGAELPALVADIKSAMRRAGTVGLRGGTGAKFLKP